MPVMGCYARLLRFEVCVLGIAIFSIFFIIALGAIQNSALTLTDKKVVSLITSDSKDNEGAAAAAADHRSKRFFLESKHHESNALHHNNNNNSKMNGGGGERRLNLNSSLTRVKKLTNSNYALEFQQHWSRNVQNFKEDHHRKKEDASLLSLPPSDDKENVKVKDTGRIKFLRRNSSNTLGHSAGNDNNVNDIISTKQPSSSILINKSHSTNNMQALQASQSKSNPETENVSHGRINNLSSTHNTPSGSKSESDIKKSDNNGGRKTKNRVQIQKPHKTSTSISTTTNPPQVLNEKVTPNVTTEQLSTSSRSHYTTIAVPHPATKGNNR